MSLISANELREMSTQEMRRQHDALRAKATNLRAEIRDDTAPDEVRRIEESHTSTLAEATQLGHELLNRGAAASDAFRINNHVQMDGGSPDALAAAIGDALHGRLVGRSTDGPGAEWRARSLLDMGAALIEARGDRPDRSNKTRLAEQMFARSMHTTSDFTTLLTSAGNRVLLNSYETAQSPLRRLARERTATDFRSLTNIRLSEAPKLLQVNEHGEIKRGSMGEAKEAYRVKTFGRMFGLTRTAIVNDDLGAFSDMAAQFGRAAAETEADEMVALFTANSGNGATLDDGLPLYSTDAKRLNKAAAGATMSVVTLSTGRQAMRDQVGMDGTTPINAVPAFVVVGTSMETTAEQTLQSNAIVAATVSNVNPFQGRITPLVEPRLSGASWRLFADPAQLAVFSIAYLDGNRGPQFQMREGWDVLGVEWRAILDFGTGIESGGYRGTYLNAGA